tara:strand:- start:215 stop:2821 length:2607 start_codon:yes stop_codon:yes gene_type:complete
MPIRRLDKTLTATTATVAGEDIAANSIPVKPHIQYGVLQPAVAGKLLNGATHSGAYGTAQTQSGGDGHSYYYTDIKGSKPIKDPRIGAHFGSQRHKFKSLQLLEQETATHGNDVFSFDGREWIRGVGGWTNWIDGASSGGAISSTQNDFFEITGYFSNANYIAFTDTNDRSIRVTIDGGTEDTTVYGGAIGAANPLSSRYVDAGNLHQIATTTLGIHTIKIRKQGTASTTAVNGIELIAQDTTSTATKSKIQIPAQNVVSYGKKFAISATAQHYDPFNGFTNGSSVTAYVDTATSLGVEAWKNSSTYYRPYNGGRVVKWIASDGTIKTSVNMMPPNARSIGNSSSLTNATAKANASIANNTFYPTMEAGAIDHSLAEVAKAYMLREFGNGSANGGTGSATYADASMLSGTADDVAYVMDDGLTSFSGNSLWISNGDRFVQDGSSGKNLYITFIGTGISIKQNSVNHAGSDSFKYYIDGILVKTWSSGTVPEWQTIAQNLSYGTHILRMELAGVSNSREYWREATFHQPKMPPIPEDAVIISDYMLMADFVKQTATATDISGQISKGSRLVGSTRDHFYNSSAAFHADSGKPRGDVIGLSVKNGSADATAKLPFFGTTGAFHVAASNQAWPCELGGSAATETKLDNTADSVRDAITIAETVTLGQTSIQTTIPSGEYIFVSTQVATPIHTSSHYQPFETPFLKELVGGDRNMEQNNLIVTADGKSWDEVTRNTSYLGNTNISTTIDVNETSDDAIMKFDEWRGQLGTVKSWHSNKDFAIAYDRVICLVDGHYEIHVQTISAGAGTNGRHGSIKINGVLTLSGHTGQSNLTSSVSDLNIFLKRGDYVQVTGKWYGGSGGHFDNFQIKRIN